MKRIIIILAAIAITTGSYAQTATVENGIKMYQYQKYQAAQKILSQFAATDARANYYLGLCQLTACDGGKAQALETFKKYPDDLANIAGTAMVAFANKEIGKGTGIAKDLAGRARKKDWLPLKYAADALTYSEGADYNQAVAWYKEILAKNVTDPDVYIGLGDANKKIQGGGGEAENNYERAISKDPKNSLAYTRSGDLWADARKKDLAIENYGKAKDADNTNPLPYKGLADLYTRTGEYQKALINIKTYLDMSDNSLTDQVSYMEILYLTKNYCDAKVLAQKFLQSSNQCLDISKAELYGVLGFSMAYCNDSVNAVDNIRKYFQMQNPKKITPNDYIEFGKVWLKTDNLDSAAVYYMKGIAGDTSKNKTDIYRQIAEAYRLKKQFLKSNDWYEQIIKANPDTQPIDYFYRGLNYFYNGNLDKAVNAFDEFEKKYPRQPSATYWHARSLAAIDSEAKSCTASPYFINWIDSIGAQADTKKKDMKIAYEYLLLCAYNNDKKEDIDAYIEKLKAIDPNDNLMLQIEKAMKAPAQKKGKSK